MPLAVTWIDSEGIMLSDMCQSQTNAVLYHLYVESKLYNKLVNVTQVERTNSSSKWGKEYVKAVDCHPVYLTYMQSTS